MGLAASFFLLVAVIYVHLTVLIFIKLFWVLDFSSARKFFKPQQLFCLGFTQSLSSVKSQNVSTLEVYLTTHILAYTYT